MLHSLQSQFCSVSFAWPASLCCDKYMDIYIYDCIEIIFVLLLPNNTVSETFLHKLWTVRSVDRMFVTGVPVVVTGWVRDIGQNVLVFLKGSISKRSYFYMLFLIRFIEEAFIIRNIIILLCINFIIIICTDVSNGVINNNYGRLPYLILLFKISMGICKDFLEPHR